MKVTKSDFSDDSFSARQGWARLFKHDTESGVYWTGEVVDPRGIVSVYRQIDHPMTRLDYVHAGRCWARSWDACWGDRTLPGLARQFISDVLEGDLR